MSVTNQNDLKKNVGVSVLKVTDTYNYNSWTKIKNEISHQPDGISHTLKASYSLYKEKVLLELSNTCAQKNGQWDFFNPNISLLSKQIEPYTVQAGLAGGLNFGLTKDIPEDGKLGWQVNLSVNGAESMSISPTINYKLTPKISASLNMSL